MHGLPRPQVIRCDKQIRNANTVEAWKARKVEHVRDRTAGASLTTELCHLLTAPRLTYCNSCSCALRALTAADCGTSRTCSITSELTTRSTGGGSASKRLSSQARVG